MRQIKNAISADMIRIFAQTLDQKQEEILYHMSSTAKSSPYKKSYYLDQHENSFEF